MGAHYARFGVKLYISAKINVSNITDLPEWLDNFIFNELNACYAPDHIKHEHNLHLGKEDVLNYLGTYFPRSYIESLYIYRTLFGSESYKKTISSKDELNVLDFGCGTAGEIFGLVSAIEANLPNVSKLNILAIDGNQHALRIAHRICAEYLKNSGLQIKFSDSLVYLQEKNDLKDVVEVLSSKSFDFILSFKTIGELVSSNTFSRDNPYKYFATLFSPLLTQTGVLLLEDVTIKNEKIAMFLPKYMNIGVNSFLYDNSIFRNILPVHCMCSQQKCSEGCFFKSEIRVNHSRKQGDLSKIAYRMIAREALCNAIHDSIVNIDTGVKCKFHNE